MEEWKLIETAPEEGVFLVYMEDEEDKYKIQVADWHPKVKAIGNHFVGDWNAKPTHWMPLPSPPSA